MHNFKFLVGFSFCCLVIACSKNEMSVKEYDEKLAQEALAMNKGASESKQRGSASYERSAVSSQDLGYLGCIREGLPEIVPGKRLTMIADHSGCDETGGKVLVELEKKEDGYLHFSFIAKDFKNKKIGTIRGQEAGIIKGSFGWKFPYTKKVDTMFEFLEAFTTAHSQAEYTLKGNMELWDLENKNKIASFTGEEIHKRERGDFKIKMILLHTKYPNGEFVKIEAYKDTWLKTSAKGYEGKVKVTTKNGTYTGSFDENGKLIF